MPSNNIICSVKKELFNGTVIGVTCDTWIILLYIRKLFFTEQRMLLLTFVMAAAEQTRNVSPC